MDISIFGHKFNLEILILIGIVYLILFLHTVCPCTNMPKLYEGLSNMVNPTDSKKPKQSVSSTAMSTGKKEGFYSGMSSMELDSPAPYKLGDYTPTDTSSWMQPDLSVVPGQPLSKGVNEILNRPKQPVPLPDDEMLMFANTKFTPGACPNSYSNSSGCANITVDQYNYLVTRGGNNVPYSDY